MSTLQMYISVTSRQSIIMMEETATNQQVSYNCVLYTSVCSGWRIKYTICPKNETQKKCHIN